MTLRLDFGDRAERMFGKGRTNKQWRDETPGMTSGERHRLRLEWHNRNSTGPEGTLNDSGSVNDYNRARRRVEALQMLDDLFDNSDTIANVDEKTGKPELAPSGGRSVTDLRREYDDPGGTLLQNWHEELMALQELDMAGELTEEDRPLYEALQEFMRRRTGI